MDDNFFLSSIYQVSDVNPRKMFWSITNGRYQIIGENMLNNLQDNVVVATLLWKECDDETHTPKIGTWESSGTPKTLEFDCRGQNTLHWGVFYIIGKLSKCRCWKWARMGHLDICDTSYGKKKGQESNWQFDSRPLKVKNRPDPNACRWSAIHYWKYLEESYKFASDLILIEGLNKELWPRKVPKVQIGTILGLLFGSPGTKSHSDVGAMKRHKVYYMGEGGGFPESGPWWVLWVQSCPWLVLALKVLQKVN